jgi:hypothetical protein
MALAEEHGLTRDRQILSEIFLGKGNFSKQLLAVNVATDGHGGLRAVLYAYVPRPHMLKPKLVSDGDAKRLGVFSTRNSTKM